MEKQDLIDIIFVGSSEIESDIKSLFRKDILESDVESLEEIERKLLRAYLAIKGYKELIKG